MRSELQDTLSRYGELRKPLVQELPKDDDRQLYSVLDTNWMIFAAESR